MKKKLLSILLLVGVMAGIVGGCGSESESTSNKSEAEGKLETIRLGVWTGGVDQYIAVIGQEKGIFEKYGLQVETTEFATGIDTVDAIVTGQEDIGMIADYAGVNRIGNTKEDFNGRILARYTTTTNWSLYVNPDVVTSIEDLAGNGVAVNQGTIVDYYTAITYEKAGIAAEEQKKVNVDSMQTAITVLSSGDAVAYWTTGATAQKLEELGFEKLLGLDDLGLTVDAYYVSSDSYIAEKEETIEKFFSAVAETEEWILENKEETAEIVESKTNIPKEQVIANIDDSKLLLDFKQDSIDHLNDIKEWALEAGNFENDFDIAEFVDTKSLKKIFPENVK